MTYKQSILTHKHWSPTGSFGFSPAGILARLKNAVKLNIPVGYQDESGFNYGVKTASKDSKMTAA